MMRFLIKVLIISLFMVGAKARDINAVLLVTQKEQINTAFILATSVQKTLEKDENADIEVIIGGSAVSVFGSNDTKDLELKDKIKALASTKAIRVVACKGALKRAKIDAGVLPKNIELVRAAPREFVLRQLDGYAVLEP